MHMNACGCTDAYFRDRQVLFSSLVCFYVFSKTLIPKVHIDPEILLGFWNKQVWRVNYQSWFLRVSLISVFLSSSNRLNLIDGESLRKAPGFTAAAVAHCGSGGAPPPALWTAQDRWTSPRNGYQGLFHTTA